MLLLFGITIISCKRYRDGAYSSFKLFCVQSLANESRVIHTQKWGNFVMTLPITSLLQLLDMAYLEIGQNSSRVVVVFIHVTYWSADLVQRSTLFNCVETKSSCMLISVTAEAVFSVNSGQSFSGKSKSAEGLYLQYARSAYHSYLPIAQMSLVDAQYWKLWEDKLSEKPFQHFFLPYPT